MAVGVEAAVETFSILALLLVIFGTIGNILSILLCLRQNLRCLPTFVFLLFICVNDIICLYGWNFDHFLQTFFGFVLEDLNIWSCKIVSLFQFFSLQASAWLLVAMSLERYLCVTISYWRKQYFNSNRAFLVSILIMAALFIANTNLLYTINYDYHNNSESNTSLCYNAPGYHVWHEVHTYTYSIVPFALLAIINALLLHKVVFSQNSLNIKRSDKSNHKRRAMTISVICMTISFICLTLPSAVAGAYFLGQLFSSRLGLAILYLCNDIGFSYHALNFIVFFISNKQFSREIKIVFSKAKENTNSRTTATPEDE